MLTAAATGYLTGLSLIVVIGAQNAFVLRQGLMRTHVFWICMVCGLSDAVLISIGIAANGTITSTYPEAVTLLSWGGAAFLITYGALSLRRALRPGSLRAADQGTQSLRGALATCLALTWLNPHVYLDTVALIGALSGTFPDLPDRIAYAFGAISASFVFFVSLGYGAGSLAPIFARPGAWAVLDSVIAMVMWSIAAWLLLRA